jgi:alpha-L-arabinofuranosidase
MNFCEAAGFQYVPAFCMGEAPQDMADFVEYAEGSTQSEWGRKPAADGHPAPYRLKYLELGNEECLDENYWQKFKPLAQAIWAKDPEVILVVGDISYAQPIQDPFHFQGAASGITSLIGHQQILRLANQQDREVWFDVHVGTDGPRPDSAVVGMLSYRDALARVAQGARHKAAANDSLDVNAKRSEDGRTLVLQAVTLADKPVLAQIHLGGFVCRKPMAQVTELSGPLAAANTANQPNTVIPQSGLWRHALKDGRTSYTFPPYSVTVLRLE